MSYRDELEAAHARIEGLERQLASGEPLRETETVRALRDEVDVLQQQLAAHRSIATHSQASLDAQLHSQREVAAAHAARAEDLLEATKQALEGRVRAAELERTQAELSLEELAGLSRPTALRLYQERLAAVVAERARLAASSAAALVPQPAAGAPMEEQVRFAMAQNVIKVNQTQDVRLAESEARLTRLCTLLEQPPRA
ncbi:MAG: hypothetical protein IPG17_00925 [Sandaracinaceae bacterium]|jgi:hypothetical protein|nr:hypothetical protein [Sandaracinaceae bacterium]MBK7153168.1 hypothetical protein [Sandaracinaceae bacterium]MBK8411306.1 hypothetical protein [Sandaracinaceae bacterium]MBK8589142.1 hypothetical protein [Sandaracinaceae bacterium]MBP7680957.1 hypothetical protein [Deltaproteobacteria bacterium]